MQYLCLLFSLCVHEAAHAAMANYCGDPSARMLGRLTLDPRKHVDPIGTVLMPLMMLATNVPLIGWAKPVPINPRNLRNMRRDQVWIALAGPASNILIALCAVFIIRIFLLIALMTGGIAGFEVLINVFMMLIMINVMLALFNMLPVPPLDGHYLVRYFLPIGAERVLMQIGPWGIILAFFLARPWLNLTFVPAMNFIKGLILFGQPGMGQ